MTKEDEGFFSVFFCFVFRFAEAKSRFMRTYEGTPSYDRNNNEDRNAPIAAYQRATISDT